MTGPDFMSIILSSGLGTELRFNASTATTHTTSIHLESNWDSGSPQVRTISRALATPALHDGSEVAWLWVSFFITLTVATPKPVATAVSRT
jgi:hypothetical protein